MNSLTTAAILPTPTLVLVLLGLIAVAAALYSSVGHGGASGYIAAMALLGVAPVLMKPAALAMNIVVTAFVLTRLWRHFDWPLFWPFALGSVPAAFAGGAWSSPDVVYRYLVGMALLVAALWLLRARHDVVPIGRPPVWAALPLGVGIGFIAGLTGVGGGIFLSPLLLLFRWADLRTTATVSAAFILVNSVAALSGHARGVVVWPAELPLMATAALLGGWIGSELSMRKFAPVHLRRVLGLVLMVAGLKMFAFI